jgi:CheY-like chemotaxis protein
MFQIGSEVYFFPDRSISKPIETQRKVRNKSEAAPKPTVLVVDDQQMVADTTAEVLNRSGYRAVCAYSGESALALALELKPDYLLTDVLMPGMNGVELAIAISKQLPKTKIVLFSGQAGLSDSLTQATDNGYSFDLLAKPLHPSKLLQHLKQKR